MTHRVSVLASMQWAVKGIDKRVLYWLLRKSWWSYLSAFVGGSMASILSAEAFNAYLALLFILGPLNRVRELGRNRAIVVLPVDRWRISVTFWFATVILVPIAFTAGPLLMMFVGAVSPGFVASRALLAMGIAASFSVLFAYLAVNESRIERFGVARRLLALGTPASIALAMASALAWFMSAYAVGTGKQEVLIMLAALTLVVASFHFAEQAWFPRPPTQIHGTPAPLPSRRPNFGVMRENRWAACLRQFWGPSAALGAAVWIGILTILSLVNLYFHGTMEFSPNEDQLTISVALMTLTGVLSAALLPSMRCLRMLPISSRAHVLLLLSTPASAYTSMVVLVPLGSRLFGWPPLMTSAALLFMLSVNLLLTIAIITMGFRISGVLSLLILLFLALSEAMFRLPVGGMLVVAILLSVAAFWSAGCLVRRSSRLYRGKSLQEEIIALAQRGQ